MCVSLMWVYLNTFISVLKEIYVTCACVYCTHEKCGQTGIEAKCGLLMGKQHKDGR